MTLRAGEACLSRRAYRQRSIPPPRRRGRLAGL